MIIPQLSLNFTTAALDSRITFARTTSASNPATYVNSSGVVASATNNSPRFDYNSVALTCKGLLIEESRSNICLWSEDVRNTADAGSTRPWTYANSSVSADTTVAPDGNTTADKVIANAGYAAHVIQQAITTTAVAYTFSVFAKAAGLNYICLFNVTAGGARVFNLSNGTYGGTVGQATPTNSFIQDFGNGWYRCQITITATAAANTFRFALLDTDSSIFQFTGNGVDGVYLWGAQVEAGASATSYIPTTTTALTRNADVATITGSNFSSFWQASRGGVLVRALPSTVSGTRPLVQFDDATADNIIALRGNTTNPELYIVDGGTPQATIDAGTIPVPATPSDPWLPYRLAGTWAAGNAAASLNSGTAVLGAPGAIPTATQARLGSDGTNYLNGHLQALEYYDSRILNGNLPLLSSSAGYNRVLGPVLRDQVNVSQVNHRVIY